MNSAQRPRAMLPGGSGSHPFSRLLGGGQSAPPFSPASRVSISELFGGRFSYVALVMGLGAGSNLAHTSTHCQAHRGDKED